MAADAAPVCPEAPGAVVTDRMEGRDGFALLRLLTWMSPAFPVGAFAFSHGLETAIADRRIIGADSASDWIEALLFHGSGWNDLVLFKDAHDATAGGDGMRLAAVRELGIALAGSLERRAETLALGEAFQIASAPWHTHRGDGAPAPYPVAVAELAAAAGIPLGIALTAFAHAFAANLVGAATRLVPLGQSDAVQVLKRLEQPILDVCARAERSDLSDLGSAAILSDIAAMRHETLSTRLFRS